MNYKPLIDLLKEFEGLRLNAYLDAVKVWTIGYGTTVYPNGQKVKKGDRCSKEQAIEYMCHDIETIRLPAINKYVKVELTNNETCALISLCYNIGVGNFGKSTLVKKLNANMDAERVAAEFLKWVKAGGKTLKGLVRRREAERQLFLKPDPPEIVKS